MTACDLILGRKTEHTPVFRVVIAAHICVSFLLLPLVHVAGKLSKMYEVSGETHGSAENQEDNRNPHQHMIQNPHERCFLLAFWEFSCMDFEQDLADEPRNETITAVCDDFGNIHKYHPNQKYTGNAVCGQALPGFSVHFDEYKEHRKQIICFR